MLTYIYICVYIISYLSNNTKTVFRRFKEVRRYSNVDVCEKIAPPVPARRRASELPPAKASTGSAASQSSGIVCTNTDLLSIMNSLKSTASKALQQTAAAGRPHGGSKTTDSLPGVGGSVGGLVDRRRDVLRTGRSNSVDVANLGATAAMAAASAGNSTRNWFRKMSERASAAAVATAVGQRSGGADVAERAAAVEQQQQQRPATIGGGEYVVQKSPVVVTFADERPKVSLLQVRRHLEAR